MAYRSAAPLAMAVAALRRCILLALFLPTSPVAKSSTNNVI